MMLDWDVETLPGHQTAECCTITSREEVIEILDEFCKTHPQYLFDVQETPGGVRAFELSREWDASSREAVEFHTNLRVDPLYTRLSSHIGKYRARVSPKPARVGDYVALDWCVIGTGDANRRCLKQLEEYKATVRKMRSAMLCAVGAI